MVWRRLNARIVYGDARHWVDWRFRWSALEGESSFGSPLSGPIEPLNGEEMRLSAAWLETLDKGTTPQGNDLARAVRAESPIKAVYVVGMLTIIAVAGSLIIWGQSWKGPMGDQGPPGPKGPQGDTGPPTTTSGIRIVRSNCDETTCQVQCGENEMLLTAYCGPKRNPAIIPTERAATCRNPMPVNSPIVAVCALVASP